MHNALLKSLLLLILIYPTLFAEPTSSEPETLPLPESEERYDTVVITPMKNPSNSLPDPLTILPNPAQMGDKMWFSFPSLSYGTATITILDVVGNSVFETSYFCEYPGQPFSWDLRNNQGWPVGNGTYIALITFTSHRSGNVSKFQERIGVKQ